MITEFEDWWDDEREQTGKDYVMLGPFALRNVAWVAWNAGQDALKEKQKHENKCTCERCTGIAIESLY